MQRRQRTVRIWLGDLDLKGPHHFTPPDVPMDWWLVKVQVYIDKVVFHYRTD